MTEFLYLHQEGDHDLWLKCRECGAGVSCSSSDVYSQDVFKAVHNVSCGAEPGDD